MERKNKIKLPKDFFSISRPTITTKEALKNVIPIEWEDEKKNTKKNDKSKIVTLKNTRNY